MKVSFATNNGDLGGGEMVLLNLARAAREAGHDPLIVAPTAPAGVLREAANQGLPTVEIHALDRPSYLRGLRRWDYAARTGLLWCNGLVPAMATAGRPLRVVHLHQIPRSPAQWVAARASAAGAVRLVVPSHAMADLVGTRLGRRPLPLWNWTQPFAPAGHVPSPGPTRLGFLGRLGPDKGIDVLAHALALLDQRHPGAFRLTLAGEPRFADAAAITAVEASLASIASLVDRVGWLTPTEFFARVDLAVFPSTAFETFGLVVAEAQCARAPFVISDAGALPEVAGPDHPWIARAGSAESLADVIARAIANPDPAVTDAARVRWEQHFSPEAGRERLTTILSEIDATQ